MVIFRALNNEYLALIAKLCVISFSLNVNWVFDLAASLLSIELHHYMENHSLGRISFALHIIGKRFAENATHYL